jgi:hypothetical protein
MSPLFRRRRKAEALLEEIRDPANIEAQLQMAARPLDDPVAQGLRTRAEYFATADDAAELLPAYIALAAIEHLKTLEAAGTVSDDEIAGGTALTTVLQGIGIRLAEHVTATAPTTLDHTVGVDLEGPDPHRAAARAARDLFGREPGDWFAPGSETWQQLSHSAWMTGAAASRAFGGGFAAQIPYDELFAFGYALACIADVTDPSWREPILNA